MDLREWIRKAGGFGKRVLRRTEAKKCRSGIAGFGEPRYGIPRVGMGSNSAKRKRRSQTLTKKNKPAARVFGNDGHNSHMEPVGRTGDEWALQETDWLSLHSPFSFSFRSYLIDQRSFRP